MAHRAYAGPPRRFVTRGRLLVAAVACTILVLLVDLAGGSAPTTLRSAGAVVFGPVERVLGRDRDDETARLRGERDQLATEVRSQAEALSAARAESALLESPSAAGARILAARIVGVGRPGPMGPERVTLDVGTRDGIDVDRTVVAAGGLVGRVVSVGPWTCDVALLGSPDVVVAARVGSAGVLATVRGAGQATSPVVSAGPLVVELVQPGQMTSGDEVRTLGSVGGRPFVRGILVGQVASVDPLHGRLAAGGAVAPAVDTSSLDVVGVLLTAPRVSPRPFATGGAR